MARKLGYPHPPVFLQKSAEVIENKGRESKKECKERSRVRKRKEVKEIEEVKEVEGENPARFVRDNTRNATIDAVCLSIVNCKCKQMNSLRVPFLSWVRRNCGKRGHGELLSG